MSLPLNGGGGFGGSDGGGDDGPGRPFKKGGGRFDNDSPSKPSNNKKRGLRSNKNIKDDNSDAANSSSFNNYIDTIHQSPSEDTTAAETSVGSDSIVSGITNPSNLHAAASSSAILTHQGGSGGAVAFNATPGPGAAAVAAATTPQNPNAISTSNNNNNASNSSSQLATVNEQRRRLLRQLRHIGIATGSTFVVAILSVIPIPFLMAFLICSAALSGLLYQLYQTFLFELNLMMQGRGIGDYLPAAVYEQLTRTSLHEYMSDRSYVNENAYLMLYFIPGLSRDQIDAYVGRLAPRHQNTLHRPGLGNFLGPSFMRLILGDERLRGTPAQIVNASPTPSSLASLGAEDADVATTSSSVVPRRLVLPPTIPEEGADDTSDLGEEEDPTNVPVPSIEVQAPNASLAATPMQTPAAPASQQTAQEADEAIRAESEAEELVIYDAIGSAIATYMGVAADMVQTSARRSASMFSGSIFRATATAAMFGVGVSIYGFWTGVYNPQTFLRPTMQMIGDQMSSLMRPARYLRPQFPSSNVLVTSTLLSGATASIMLIFQIANAKEESSNDDDNEDQEGGDRSTTQKS